MFQFGRFPHCNYGFITVSYDMTRKGKADLVSHKGEEFNLVLEGTVVVTFGDQDIVLEKGDSIYFNPTYPHGQRCGGDTPATFLTMIAE